MQPGPVRPKKNNTLLIVLGVFGVFGLLALGTCAAGAFWLKGKAEEALEAGVMLTEAPAEVIAELAGPKKDYVGTWTSETGSVLAIDPSGNILLETREGGSSQRMRTPIAAFSGNDIQIRAIVTIPIVVTEPPRQVDGRWRMIANGMRYERE